MARRLQKPKYEVVGEIERYEESDNIQARVALEPDGELWKAYYAKHPELEEQGRALAKLPPMGSVGPVQDNLMTAATMYTINLLCTEEAVDGPPLPQRIDISPERATEKLKGFARHLGADLVGIGPLNKAYTYTHVGRSSSPGTVIGTPIDLPHHQAIVVAIGLDRDMLGTAPQLPSMLEIMKKYLRLASIVVTLARYLRMLGYSARAHDIFNYQVVIPPVAADAGLGELARHGVLITEEFGSAVKMAVVTTDMPLVNDSPVDLGVDEFCQQCKICAEYCPVSAISKGEKRVVRGVRKWPLNDIACYGYFRKVGTDCGICMSVCPWTRPRHFPHNAVLRTVERCGLARKIAISYENIFGSRKRKKRPDWLEEQPESWRDGLGPKHPFYRQGR